MTQARRGNKAIVPNLLIILLCMAIIVLILILLSKVNKAQQDSDGSGSAIPSDTEADVAEGGWEGEYAFSLTETDIDFLEDLCRCMGDYFEQYEVDEAYLSEFIFNYYQIGRDGSEDEDRYDSEYNDYLTYMKVDKKIIDDLILLIFGDALESDMGDKVFDRYAEYDPDKRCYYFWPSGYEMVSYTYKGHEINYNKDNNMIVTVLFDICDPDEPDPYGRVVIKLKPYDNKNGFIVCEKYTEY